MSIITCQYSDPDTGERCDLDGDHVLPGGHAYCQKHAAIVTQRRQSTGPNRTDLRTDLQRSLSWSSENFA